MEWVYLLARTLARVELPSRRFAERVSLVITLRNVLLLRNSLQVLKNQAEVLK